MHKLNQEVTCKKLIKIKEEIRKKCVRPHDKSLAKARDGFEFLVGVPYRGVWKCITPSICGGANVCS